jgi:hypothetical protein
LNLTHKVIPFHRPDKDTGADQCVKATRAGNCWLFLFAFLGLDTVPGYALFGAYEVKWIRLFNKAADILLIMSQFM